jgi:hypothetical protein
MLFLIEYDRGQGRIVSIQEFDDAERRAAEKARLELELSQNRLGANHEIVLMEAIDELTLRKTHRRYFESLDELAKAS